MNTLNVNYTRAEDLKRLEYIKQCISMANSSKKQLNILDVGCGNGNISRFAGSLGHNVLGIDVSSDAIRTARQLTQLSNVRFRNLPAEELISDSEFDVIICSEVIEHLSEPEKVVTTLSKLLSKTGVLVITVPNGFGPREVLITKPMQNIKSNYPIIYKSIHKIKSILGFKGTTIQSDAGDLTHIQFFTKKSLTHLISKNGFEQLSFKGSNFIEGVFPFSLLTKKSIKLQQFDCWLADQLPHSFTSGFMSAWKLNKTQ